MRDVEFGRWKVSLLVLMLPFVVAACSGGGGSEEPDDEPEPDAATDTMEPDPDSGMPDSRPQDMFEGECRQVSDCAPPPSDLHKVASCNDNNECVYECAPGFQDDNNDDTCEFGPLLEDRSFESSDAWQTDNAFIDTSAGNLIFGPEASSEGARASQSYEVGGPADVGPLKLEITYSLNQCEAGDCALKPSYAPVALFDGRWKRLDSAVRPVIDQKTVSQCVGLAAYDGFDGGTVDLTLMPGVTPFSREQIEIQQLPETVIHDVSFKQVDASECPSFGDVENGDFEGSMASPWTLYSGGNNTMTRVIDQGGDSTLELGGTECTFATAEQKISIPKSDETALSFELDVTGGAPLLVDLPRGALSKKFFGTDGPETKHICVPDADRGTVKTMTLEADPVGLSRDCGQDVSSTYIDDVRFTQRSECTDLGQIPGGSFEDPTARTLWRMDDGIEGESISFPSESTPNGQNTYANLSVSRTCVEPKARLQVQVPSSSDNSSVNALKFFYRTRDASNLDTNLEVVNLINERNLPASTSWSQETVCFPTGARGYLIEVVNEIYGGDSNCGDTLPSNGELHLDRFEFVSDPNCVQ